MTPDRSGSRTPGRTELAKRILDSELTDFQKKVLLRTLDIPRGQVRTYESIAASAGAPGACRAVGSALSKNPFAPEVPCHRVVRKNGSAGGYAGGEKAKKRLLKKEGVRMNTDTEADT